MSASREFKNLQTTPLARGSRTRGGFLAPFIQAEKVAEMASPAIAALPSGSAAAVSSLSFRGEVDWDEEGEGEDLPMEKEVS